ncbi:uncharacterized protein EI90DRAFT_3070792 [Cantharellus anzutake]|uniref:uncharacterized protein n=1 Tax=Cantharellus anzutake TaxID=1750568 RepID=UPI001903BC17|nr:uncharacterized protein EI90DRAFT_3070792 [Cantharellus anzutake]KAF8326396.1 hypothetical protein EI90DRAFT_3070792 [Cantharellus anzutake]
MLNEAARMPAEGVEPGPVPPNDAEAVMEDQEKGVSLPPDASETLYISNLNESIKLSVMKQVLHGLFKNYGEVLDVVLHKNLRMRGQAFISFGDVETAALARKEVQGFPLYQKPMQLAFARTRSDAVIKKLTPDDFEGHKRTRLEHKRKQRWNNPHKRKARAKHNAGQAEGLAAPAPKRPAVQMPDEYLPPNKILFLQNLPETTTQKQLVELFAQYPNLLEVRMVPTKKDIAFVEYTDEKSSSVAKDALHNYRLDEEHKIKITFARK